MPMPANSASKRIRRPAVGVTGRPEFFRRVCPMTTIVDNVLTETTGSRDLPAPPPNFTTDSTYHVGSTNRCGPRHWCGARAVVARPPRSRSAQHEESPMPANWFARFHSPPGPGPPPPAAAPPSAAGPRSSRWRAASSSRPSTSATRRTAGPAAFARPSSTRIIPPPPPASPNVISFSGSTTSCRSSSSPQLPTITQPVIIDGTTAASYNGAHPSSSSSATTRAARRSGLDITASGTQVKALAIDGFNAGGVLVDNASNVVLDHDYVGLDTHGNAIGQRCVMGTPSTRATASMA